MTWFIPQVVRYRKLIGEVLLITLALNLLGLAAPLFFQNVIDKVLVHNTLATLQVLSIGFVAVSLWEVMFGWLRTRLYSETSQSSVRSSSAIFSDCHYHISRTAASATRSRVCGSSKRSGNS